MNALVGLTIQFAIGIVLLCSCVGKWLNPLRFARNVGNYELLPQRLGYWFGLLVIPLETWLALAHLTGWKLQLAVRVTLALFASFAFAISINLLRGHRLPCYCFGENDDELISGSTLLRLAILLLGEAALLRRHYAEKMTSLVFATTPAHESIGFAVLTAVLVLIATTWLLSIPDLFDLLRPCPRCGSNKEA